MSVMVDSICYCLDKLADYHYKFSDMNEQSIDFFYQGPSFDIVKLCHIQTKI